MFRSHPFVPLRRHKPAGFTLVELMVVVLIAAILLGLGVPALQTLVAANQLNGVTDGFASALNEARSEAAKFGVNVALTPTNGGVDWGGGWTMATAPVGALPAGMPGTLRTGTAVPAGYTMKSNAPFAGGVTFDPTGRLAAGAAGEFVICQGGGPAGGGKAQMVSVAASGRVRVSQNDPSGYPINDAGVTVTTCSP